VNRLTAQNYTSDSNSLESGVRECVSLEQAQPPRRQALAVGREHVIGDPVAPDEMREVVILFDSFARSGDDGLEPSFQLSILDMLDFARQLDPAVPDFQGRQRGQGTATVVAAAARARLLENFASNATTATLAASLLRSIVKSTPGKVSSKLLISNRMSSSGV
jgi:hypothetical protein